MSNVVRFPADRTGTRRGTGNPRLSLAFAIAAMPVRTGAAWAGVWFDFANRFWGVYEAGLTRGSVTSRGASRRPQSTSDAG